jgi:cytochrome c peroxidase
MRIAILFLALLFVVACGESKPDWREANPIVDLPTPPVGVEGKIDWKKVKDQQGLEVTPAKVRLGRMLFFDTRLSADNTVSCATCHRPENAFSEPTPVSTGIRGQKGDRKAPPVVNAAVTMFPVYFWDGRAASLAEQAKGPIENPIEMGNTHDAAVKTIQAIAGYREAFKDAYGDEQVDIDRIADSIAAYQAGDDHAIDEEVLKGFDLFHDKAECNQCHLGLNFTDAKFHSLGVGWDARLGKYKDEGRFKVTQKAEDLGAFKTPPLRDVTLHAPYMHDGSMKTLEAVMSHYNEGGTPGAKNLSSKVRKLNLTPEEIKAVIAFMEALTSDGAFQIQAPVSLP